MNKFIYLFFVLFFGVQISAQDVIFDAPETLFDIPSNRRAEFGTYFHPFDHQQDGDTDFAGTASGSAHYIITNDGNGSFEDVNVFSSLAFDVSLVADVNSDGLMDLVMTHYILLQDENGDFEKYEPFSIRPAVIVDVLDMDGNGHKDLVVHNAGTFSGGDVLSIYYNDGMNLNADTLDTEGFELGEMEIGDVDNDGSPDIVAYIDYTPDAQAYVFYNKENGFETSYVPKIHNRSNESMKLTDLDGDGDLDLVISSNGDDFYLLENDNGFDNANADRRVRVDDFIFFQAGDLDNDGDDDIVFQGRTDDWDFRVSMAINKGNFEFDDPVELVVYPGNTSFGFSGNPNLYNKSMSIYDYDRDGKKDIMYISGYEEPSPMMLLRNNSIITSDSEIRLEPAFQISPNPVSNFINVHLDGQSFQGTYNILDMNGKQLMKGEMTDGQLNVTALESGSYIINLPEQRVQSRFIKI